MSLAGKQRILKRHVVGNHAKCIGIKNQRYRSSDGIGQTLAGFVGKAQAAAHDIAGGLREINFAVGDHEFRIDRVESRGLVAHEFDRDAACARHDCCTGRKNGRADRAGFAAHYSHVTVVSLVTVAAAFFEHVTEVVGFDEADRGKGNGNAEFVHFDDTGGIGAFAHEATCLRSEHGKRDVGHAALDSAHPATGHRVQTGGDVNADVQSLTFVKPHGGVLEVSCQRLFHARSKKRIDHDFGLVGVVRVADHGAACVQICVVHGKCIFGLRLVAADQGNSHAVFAIKQQSSGGKTIAAVVVGAADEDDMLAGFERFADSIGNHEAGATHEFGGGKLGLIAVFERSEFVEIENLLCHGRCNENSVSERMRNCTPRYRLFVFDHLFLGHLRKKPVDESAAVENFRTFPSPEV